jgi:hypothetical protein
LLLLLLLLLYLLGTSETLLCSMFVLLVKIVLLDALQLLKLFAGALMYSEPKLFLLIIFYNSINCTQYEYMYNHFFLGA